MAQSKKLPTIIRAGVQPPQGNTKEHCGFFYLRIAAKGAPLLRGRVPDAIYDVLEVEKKLYDETTRDTSFLARLKMKGTVHATNWKNKMMTYDDSNGSRRVTGY